MSVAYGSQEILTCFGVNQAHDPGLLWKAVLLQMNLVSMNLDRNI